MSTTVQKTTAQAIAITTVGLKDTAFFISDAKLCNASVLAEVPLSFARSALSLYILALSPKNNAPNMSNAPNITTSNKPRDEVDR